MSVKRKKASFLPNLFNIISERECSIYTVYFILSLFVRFPCFFPNTWRNKFLRAMALSLF
jgi:hypothetical protein